MRGSSGTPTARPGSNRGSNGSNGLLFHRALGSYRQKAERIERLARLDRDRRLRAARGRRRRARAAKLAKADLATDMVREFTELQGVMGGVYAREAGEPEAGVEGDLPPLSAGRCRIDARARRRALGAATRDLGVRVARRQARHTRRLVPGGRASDRLARSVWPAPAGARRAANARGPERADGRSASRPAARRAARRARKRLRGHRRRGGRRRVGGAGCVRARAARVRAAAARLARAQHPRRGPLHGHSRISGRRTSSRTCASSPEFSETESFRKLAEAFKRVRNIARELPARWRRGRSARDADRESRDRAARRDRAPARK